MGAAIATLVSIILPYAIMIGESHIQKYKDRNNKYDNNKAWADLIKVTSKIRNELPLEYEKIVNQINSMSSMQNVGGEYYNKFINLVKQKKQEYADRISQLAAKADTAITLAENEQSSYDSYDKHDLNENEKKKANEALKSRDKYLEAAKEYHQQAQQLTKEANNINLKGELTI